MIEIQQDLKIRSKVVINYSRFYLKISQKCAILMAFWHQNFAKFRTPNFAKLILQALISISRNSRNFCNTIQKTFKIIEKYVEACKTFQDFSNFWKIILDLLAIQETFKNHRNIFWSLPDIAVLVKLQESHLKPSGNPGNF